MHCAINYKTAQSPYTLYQKCRYLHLISRHEGSLIPQPQPPQSAPLLGPVKGGRWEERERKEGRERGG
eukprot:1794815-Rhodomonas_salina.2